MGIMTWSASSDGIREKIMEPSSCVIASSGLLSLLVIEENSTSVKKRRIWLVMDGLVGCMRLFVLGVRVYIRTEYLTASVECM